LAGYLILLAVVAGAVGFALGYFLAPRQDRSLLRALDEHDAFLEHLRELSWQNRDVSPELSTILLDEINRHHQQGRRPLEP